MKNTLSKKATASGPHLLTDDPQREAARTLEDLLRKRAALQPPRTKTHQQEAREKQWRPDQKRLNTILKQHPQAMLMGAEGQVGARTKLKESGEHTRNKAQDQSHLTTGETLTSVELFDSSAPDMKVLPVSLRGSSMFVGGMRQKLPWPTCSNG